MTTDDSGAAVRAVAAKVIAAVLFKRQTVDSVLPLMRDQIGVRDQGLLTHLVQGTLRWYTALEALWQANLQTPIQDRDQIIRVLLSLGLYQYAIMQQPDYVAVNTVVEAAKQLGKRQVSGLVNAVLRKTCRELSAGKSTLAAGAATHPEWLTTMIRGSVVNDDQLSSVLLANDQHPPIWLRVHPHQFQQTVDQLTANGLVMQRSQAVPTAVLLSEQSSVTQALSIGGATVAVQDVSAQYLGCVVANYAAQLPDHARVLDACAAPGGKTALLAQQFPEWQITAVDKSAHRLARLRDNLTRQSLSVDVSQADLLDEDHDFFTQSPYDLIVLDAPCSGIGVIRRHPDIKHLRVPKAIDRSAMQQAQILRNVWKLLKPGGLLIYITCSYLEAETHSVVRDFSQTYADLECHAPLMTHKILPNQRMPTLPLGKEPSDEVSFPEPLMDGFFYAVLRKL